MSSVISLFWSAVPSWHTMWSIFSYAHLSSMYLCWVQVLHPFLWVVFCWVLKVLYVFWMLVYIYLKDFSQFVLYFIYILIQIHFKIFSVGIVLLSFLDWKFSRALWLPKTSFSLATLSDKTHDVFSILLRSI